MKDDLASLYAYSRWADERVLDSLRALPRADYERELGGGWPSLRATWVHLAGATEAWVVRFDGRDATRLPTVEELPDLEDAARVLVTAHDQLAPFVSVLPAGRLEEPFTWKNLKGVAKTAPFWTVLRHVVNHGSYHRGQISSMVRRVGGKPAATDMVLWGIEVHERGSVNA